MMKNVSTQYIINSTDVSILKRNISIYYYVLWELLVLNPEVLNSIFGSQDRLTQGFHCTAEQLVL
jgi:hypothetical protein